MQILDNVRDCVLVLDNESRIVFVNSTYIEMLGVARDKVLGRKLSDIEPFAVGLEVLRTGKPVCGRSSHIASLKVDVIGDAVPLYDANKKIIGAVAVFRNVTDISKLNREVELFKNLTHQLSGTSMISYKELPEHFSTIVGDSPKMMETKAIAARVANTDATVLIYGESGVGKEVLAHAIHQSSQRARRSWVTINCAAVPEQLIESELFGYEGGAFTGALKGGRKGKFEQANSSTLFLDEVGDMSLTMQAKLLRVLQERQIDLVGGNSPRSVDVRIIAATNKKLHDQVKQGLFREDLFYRLNVVPIYIVPLRERKEDILPMAMHFLNKFNEKYNKQATFDHHVILVLEEYNWPGNIRELQNVIEHAVIICQDKIGIEHLPDYMSKSYTIIDDDINNETSIFGLKKVVAEIEKKAIQTALTLSGNNKTRAREMLGLSKRGFYQKLRKYSMYN